MTYKTIPLNAIPNQQFTVTLDGQICQIRLYWRYDNLYCDLSGVTNDINSVVVRSRSNTATAC